MRKIAIINHDFSGFTGSEIVTMEVANYFASRGDEVVIRAERFSDLFEKYLHDRVSISPRRIEISKFDIVWSQHGHFALNTENLQEIKDWKGIFIGSHLSSSTPAEVYHYPFSAKYAGGVVFNAEGVEKELTAKVPVNGITCNFRNAAPKKFHKLNVAKSKSLKKVLVVSNHLPEEVEEALLILKKMGIGIEHLGKGGVSKLVDPEDIYAVDAVISIGKSVQYSLVGGCPVYCYDHFGGPGWLSETNFEAAEKRNFSGRCSRVKKSSEDIAKELLSGYSVAKEFTSSRLLFFHERYNLESILDKFLDQIKIRGIGNIFNSQDCIDHIDLMRGALLHVSWIWKDVYGKEQFHLAQFRERELEAMRVRELTKLSRELEDSRLDAIRVLSKSWLAGFLLQPWYAKKWIYLRKKQKNYKSELN
ncbi:hypothetical protein [Ochrobactrum sp. Marseille-Q0166]|uniref:hypothetical protein n=1 Tax=Ochrobactrum sp. Marseille-Q0166 TaxID=2761105 RepID=UPI0016556E07|nr:hypothetical protein [Ochrobactrum sp. Marseille-Q0166]MBC8719035.1 hypothetical protein [Ochrobactrum sp. Marseille-Q0166]